MASPYLCLRWWLTFAALLLGVGCGSGTPPTPNPPGKDVPDAALSKVEVNRTANVTADGKDSVTITVTVVKADGKALADRTVTLAVAGEGNTLSPSTGKTDAQGVMTASLVSTVAGSKQVTASVDAEGGAVVLGTRPTVDFVAVPATKLAFTTTSIQGTAGAPLSPVLEVVLQDAGGNKVAGSTGAVTLALASGPASAQLEGTLTVNAVDGVARFSAVILKQAGTGYSLRATSGTLTAATSPTFEVVHAAPSLLELTGLPASLTADSTASVQVTLKDAFANMATHYQGTLHFSSTDASAVLPGDFIFTAADAGQKSFTGLALRTAGSQRVTVADTVNAALTASANVQVVAGALSKLVFTQQPGNHSVRAPLGTVQVALADAYGNLTALTAPSITVALNPASAGLSGTTTVAPVGGVASFTDLSIAQEGTGFQLVASASSLADVTSLPFTIVDNLAPAAAVIAATPASHTSVTIKWTAVGDDGNLGTATSYDLRYAATPITNAAEFAAATSFPISAPQPAGSGGDGHRHGPEPEQRGLFRAQGHRRGGQLQPLEQPQCGRRSVRGRDVHAAGQHLHRRRPVGRELHLRLRGLGRGGRVPGHSVGAGDVPVVRDVQRRGLRACDGRQPGRRRHHQRVQRPGLGVHRAAQHHGGRHRRARLHLAQRRGPGGGHPRHHRPERHGRHASDGARQ